jgi:hypothetical protein
MPAKAVIQHRRDSAAQWVSVNPVLAAGELGVETDTLNFKIGDGTTAWNSLAYRGFVGLDPITYTSGLVFNSGTNTLSLDFGTSTNTVLMGNHSTQTSGVHGVTGNVVGTTDVQDLSNKGFINFRERFNVVNSAANGALNIDTTTGAAWYYTVNATANFSFNFRSSSSQTLSSILPVGSAITVSVFVKNGATAYYPTAFSIDGTAVTPVWQVSAPPAAGDANAVNVYTFTILKTAATPTYAVFASQTRFD